jgi:nitrate/nitrite transport system permease protein
MQQALVIRLNARSEGTHETEANEVAPVAAADPEAHEAVAPPGKPVKPQPNRARNQRIALTLMLPAFTFLLVLAGWSYVQQHIAPELPTVSDTWDHAKSVLSDPFYDTGPNDKGIGWQLLYSLGRVGAGFGLAALVGIPLGFLMGMSANVQRALSPLIQILRPVSPLAWLPIGLLVFKAVNPSAIFVIFITCIWPMILNTATGVKAIPQDYLNVASVLKLGRLELVRRILFPATLPYVVTGMRLSLGVAWMVIVAAEMLTGGIGIGFWVWDEWNNLYVPSIILAIGLIGAVGIALDGMMGLLQMRLDYTKR